MKIDFLELVNFRNIQKQKIVFENKNFVVLIGDNGSGKTTILESITKGFVPVLRTINAEAMKKCDLTNNDIKNILIAEGQWTDDMKDIEIRIEEIALKLV